ncbi:Abi family protein [Microbacterium lacticum]
MRIPDRARAVRYLRHIGYYRLSAYTIPFQASRPHHVFRPDTSFDDILDLYMFDRALRLLVMDALERIEVAVRSAITDHMSTTYDDPFRYTDARYFASPGRHAGLLRIVRETSDARLVASPEPADTTDTATPGAGGAAVIHRSALEHYLTTYASPELPPSWLMIEPRRRPVRQLGVRVDGRHPRDHRGVQAGEPQLEPCPVLGLCALPGS